MSARFQRSLFPLCVGAALVLSGCTREHAVDDGTDESFIRVPGAAPTLAIPSGDLLPLKTGAKWSMTTRTVSRTRNRDVAGTEEIVIVGKQTPEKTRSVSPASAPEGAVMDMRKDGKSYRQEIYQAKSDGLYLSAAGSADKMTITPPLPLVKYPVKDGEIAAWSGILRFKGTAAPGTSVSRVSGRETVKTPAGSFPAYRIDTVITTTVEGRQVSFPSSRWLSPNVGIVRQVTQAGDTRLIKELKAYRIP